MKKNKQVTIIVAVVLGILTILGFVFQIIFYKKGITTPQELSLFNIIQFILTVGFSWITARIISESEYFSRLRGVAISAFRRISDIEIIVRRLRNNLQKTNLITNSEVIREISLEIVEDLNLLILSSKADWSDIIGDEIQIIEQIKTLAIEKSDLTESFEKDLDTKLEKIENKIKNLSKNLPPKLVTVDSSNVETRNYHAAKWMKEEHERHDGLILLCICGRDWGNINSLKKMKNGDSVFFKKRTKGGISVFDKNDSIIGQVLNNSPLDYKTFEETLYLCYNGKNINLIFLNITSEKAGRKKDLFEFRIQVTSKPSKVHDSIAISSY